MVTGGVGLFAGTEDLIADLDDVRKLRKDLKRAKKMIKHYPRGHFGFTFGEKLPYIEDLIEFLDIKTKKKHLI